MTPRYINLHVPITPPSPLGDVVGATVYLEIPDQSANPVFTLGTSDLSGADAVSGEWAPIPIGDFIYTGQAFFPVSYLLGGIDTAVNIRVWVAPFTKDVHAPLNRSTTPSAVVTIQPFTPGKQKSGTNITGIQVAGITAIVDANVLVGGKLKTPVECTVDLTGVPSPPPPDWAFALFGVLHNDLNNSIQLTGTFTTGGLVGAGPDGISTPHTLGLDTPTTAETMVIYAVSGLYVSSATVHLPSGATVTRKVDGQWVPNNIVPGITPSCTITWGGVPTLNLSAAILAYLNSSVTVLNNLFGVAPAGIDNQYIAALAVATANIQAAAVVTSKIANLSITNPLLGPASVDTVNVVNAAITNALIASGAVGTSNVQSLAVTTALLAAAAVTTPKVAAANITTALIANLAVTNALIANLAVGTANIQNAAITNALIGSLAVGTANIQNAAITNALIANAAVGTAQIQNLAVTNALIANLAVDSAKISSLDVAKLNAGTLTVSSPSQGIVVNDTSTGNSLSLFGGSWTLNNSPVTQRAGALLNGVGGLVSVDSNGAGTAELSMDGSGNGQVRVTGASGSGTAKLDMTSGSGRLTLRTSSGAIGFQIDANAGGYLSASAGASGSVPAQVAGYFLVDYAGTSYKIPYFPV